MGGNVMGLPSSLRTCKDAMSARHRGRASIRFLGTDRTLSELNFTSSGGKTLSLLRPRSRISREVNWHICGHYQHCFRVLFPTLYTQIAGTRGSGCFERLDIVRRYTLRIWRGMWRFGCETRQAWVIKAVSRIPQI